MPRLSITSGKRAGDFHFFSGRDISIGRLAASDLCLDDDKVSRRHAKVERREDGYCLVDLGSSNGTRVNGKGVREQMLKAGDIIGIGETDIVFEDDLPANLAFTENPLPDHGTVVKTLEDTATGVKTNRHLLTLYELGKALLAKSEISGLLNLVMDLVFKELPAQRGFLLLSDSETGSLTPSVIRTGAGDEGITVSRTITEKVLREKVSVLTADAATDPRFEAGASVFLYGIRSALCVPLWIEDDVIGILYIDTKRGESAFTEDDLDLLTAMANQAAIGIQKAQLAEKARYEAEVRSRLARYHSPAVVEHIIREGAGRGERSYTVSEKEVTVLFSDISGFTTLSENMAPSEVARLLNEYFSVMTDIVFEHGGTLDKYIGDAIMALFGAPFGKDDDAARAVKAGLRMQAELARLMEKKDGRERFGIRVGINTGMVVAGNIGSPRRVDYTVIGDAVNVAQRLESIAQPGQVLIGESTYQKVKGQFEFREVGKKKVKGKDKEVMVYEVLE